MNQNYVKSQNLPSDFEAMKRCVKSRQLQVAFARVFAAESISLIPWYHKILINDGSFFVQGSACSCLQIGAFHLIDDCCSDVYCQLHYAKLTVLVVRALAAGSRQVAVGQCQPGEGSLFVQASSLCL